MSYLEPGDAQQERDVLSTYRDTAPSKGRELETELMEVRHENNLLRVQIDGLANSCTYYRGVTIALLISLAAFVAIVIVLQIVGVS